MNCQTANELDVIKLLAEEGHQPVKISGKSAWYFCPYGEEKTPSFRVMDNVFHDFASGQHGTCVDLLVLLWKCSVKDVLEKLNNRTINYSSFPKQNKTVINDSALNVIEIKPIQSKPLYAYLWIRKINPEIGKAYLKEVVFSWKGGNPQYALGFQTNSGSWELRNSILKLSTSPKDITTFIKYGKEINVFEGFMDYLSYLQLRNNKVEADILVLNSLINVGKGFNYLDQFTKINLFLDNDAAGRSCTKKITERYSDRTVIDCSMEYEEFKDLNDFLNNKKQ